MGVDPVTGYVINRWNKKWSGRSLPVVKGRKRISGLGGGHGLWTPAIDAAASFCAYCFSLCIMDHECMGFLLMGGEPHRDIHEGDDHPGSSTDHSHPLPCATQTER